MSLGLRALHAGSAFFVFVIVLRSVLVRSNVFLSEREELDFFGVGLVQVSDWCDGSQYFLQCDSLVGGEALGEFYAEFDKHVASVVGSFPDGHAFVGDGADFSRG